MANKATYGYQKGGAAKACACEIPNLQAANENTAIANNNYRESDGQTGCKGCALFDIAKRMKSCVDKEEGVGYCWKNHFKCSAGMTCDSFEEGGPIEDDSASYAMQAKYLEEALSKEPVLSNEPADPPIPGVEPQGPQGARPVPQSMAQPPQPMMPPMSPQGMPPMEAPTFQYGGLNDFIYQDGTETDGDQSEVWGSEDFYKKYPGFSGQNISNEDYQGPQRKNVPSPVPHISRFAGVGDTNMLDVFAAVSGTVDSFKGENFIETDPESYERKSWTNTTDEDMYVNPQTGKMMTEDEKTQYYTGQMLDQRSALAPELFGQRTYNQETGEWNLEGDPTLEGDIAEAANPDADYLGFRMKDIDPTSQEFKDDPWGLENVLTQDDEGDLTHTSGQTYTASTYEGMDDHLTVDDDPYSTYELPTQRHGGAAESVLKRFISKAQLGSENLNEYGVRQRRRSPRSQMDVKNPISHYQGGGNLYTSQTENPPDQTEPYLEQERDYTQGAWGGWGYGDVDHGAMDYEPQIQPRNVVEEEDLPATDPCPPCNGVVPERVDGDCPVCEEEIIDNEEETIVEEDDDSTPGGKRTTNQWATDTYNKGRRFMDSKGMQIFDKTAAGIVNIGKPVNRMLEQRQERKRLEGMKRWTLGDNQFAVAEDEGNRGDTDVNTGARFQNKRVRSRQGKYGTELSRFIHQQGGGLEADYNFANIGSCKGAGCGNDPYKDVGASAFIGAEGNNLDDALLQGGLKGHVGKTSQSGLGFNLSGEAGAQTNLMAATEGAINPELFYKGKLSAGYTGDPITIGNDPYAPLYPGANVGGYGEYDSNSGINLGIEGGYGPLTVKGGYNVDTGSPFLGAGLNIKFQDGEEVKPSAQVVLNNPSDTINIKPTPSNPLDPRCEPGTPCYDFFVNRKNAMIKGDTSNLSDSMVVDTVRPNPSNFIPPPPVNKKRPEGMMKLQDGGEDYDKLISEDMIVDPDVLDYYNWYYQLNDDNRFAEGDTLWHQVFSDINYPGYAYSMASDQHGERDDIPLGWFTHEDIPLVGQGDDRKILNPTVDPYLKENELYQYQEDNPHLYNSPFYSDNYAKIDNTNVYLPEFGIDTQGLHEYSNAPPVLPGPNSSKYFNPENSNHIRQEQELIDEHNKHATQIEPWLKSPITLLSDPEQAWKDFKSAPVVNLFTGEEYSDNPDQIKGDLCPPGYTRRYDGSCVPDSYWSEEENDWVDSEFMMKDAQQDINRLIFKKNLTRNPFKKLTIDNFTDEEKEQYGITEETLKYHNQMPTSIRQIADQTSGMYDNISLSSDDNIFGVSSQDIFGEDSGWNSAVDIGQWFTPMAAPLWYSYLAEEIPAGLAESWETGSPAPLVNKAADLAAWMGAWKYGMKGVNSVWNKALGPAVKKGWQMFNGPHAKTLRTGLGSAARGANALAFLDFMHGVGKGDVSDTWVGKNVLSPIGNIMDKMPKDYRDWGGDLYSGWGGGGYEQSESPYCLFFGIGCGSSGNTTKSSTMGAPEVDGISGETILNKEAQLEFDKMIRNQDLTEDQIETLDIPEHMYWTGSDWATKENYPEKSFNYDKSGIPTEEKYNIDVGNTNYKGFYLDGNWHIEDVQTGQTFFNPNVNENQMEEAIGNLEQGNMEGYYPIYAGHHADKLYETPEFYTDPESKWSKKKRKDMPYEGIPISEYKKQGGGDFDPYYDDYDPIDPFNPRNMRLIDMILQHDPNFAVPFAPNSNEHIPYDVLDRLKNQFDQTEQQGPPNILPVDTVPINQIRQQVLQDGGRTQQLRNRQYDDGDQHLNDLDLDQNTIQELIAAGAEIEFI